MNNHDHLYIETPEPNLPAGLVARPEGWPWGSYRGYHRASRRVPCVTYRRVLREFGRTEEQGRRAYRRFVAEGVASSPPCPWQEAVQGLIVGAEGFVERVRGMLGRRKVDQSIPALKALRPRPSLKRIADLVAESLEADRSSWSIGRRSDDASRAVAAFLARRTYGYRTTEIAAALGYTSHGGVVTAVRRIETANPTLHRTIRQLERTLTNV